MKGQGEMFYVETLE